jgi:Protein of unknown function (DUF3300)
VARLMRTTELSHTLAVILALTLAMPWTAAAQSAAPAAASTSAPSPAFKPEEIEQLVAPVALYPDPLLAQVLMASTYPLEIVQAARWQRENPSLKDAQLDTALKTQN